MSEKLLINDGKSNNLEVKSNNEIERNEMAEIIAKNSHYQDDTWDASDYEWAAYCLQENGYRKQSEIIDEFVKRLLDAFPEPHRGGNICPSIYYDDYREIIEECGVEMRKNVVIGRRKQKENGETP